MTPFLFFIGFTIFVLVCGIAIGATIVRDALDRLWLWPRPSARPEPLPFARVLSRAEARRLEIPTVLRRRQVIDVIDIS